MGGDNGGQGPGGASRGGQSFLGECVVIFCIQEVKVVYVALRFAASLLSVSRKALNCGYMLLQRSDTE